MFTSDEMDRIEALAADRVDADQIAKAIGVHASTLERRLLKHHGIVLERIRACRLSPAPQFAVAHQQKESSRSGA